MKNLTFINFVQSRLESGRFYITTDGDEIIRQVLALINSHLGGPKTKNLWLQKAVGKAKSLELKAKVILLS
ncbi:MAG: hypothetical protein C0168_02440 [Candidatus Aminicenantes bacterium]|nr:MAG: hypothetical protein C0168_02440 [Candidatus Aminicenantes bacterium]